MYGYSGQLLFVDLGNGKIEKKELNPDWARDFLGGSGLGAKVLYDEMPAHISPFAASSMLGLVAGALNATGCLMAGRYCVVCKSPFTNGWNEATAGGMFGPALRQAGFDGVFVTGVASQPVYVYVADGGAEIRDAEELWGKTIPATQTALKQELQQKFSAAMIGPGGERCHRSACIINDSHRAAGRGGSGAVMGAKKLKAVAVAGRQKVPLADQRAIVRLNKEVVKSVFATSWDRRTRTDYACRGCPLGCGAAATAQRGYGAQRLAPPKPGTAGMFGRRLLNDDMASVASCNDLCDAYGLDTMAVADTVAWAMQCYEKGFLSRQTLDGIDLTWGNAGAIVAITEKICRGEGAGAILAEGPAFAAAYYNVGQEPLINGRGKSRDGLDRATAETPASAEHVVAEMVEAALGNACGYCRFKDYRLPRDIQLAYLNAATGRSLTEEDFLRTGRRIATLCRAFDARETVGGGRSLYAGPPGSITANTGKGDTDIYPLLGWADNGVPKKETLAALGGLEKVTADFYPEAEL